VAAAACAPRRVVQTPDHAGAHRFEILDVGDSTFRFLVVGRPWVRPGVVGIAVDPRRRDALVARFVVQQRVADTASALVTGQTARVTPMHVALLDPPRQRFGARDAFWLGVLSGGVVGTAVTLLMR
jgi:hypothetical protein